MKMLIEQALGVMPRQNAAGAVEPHERDSHEGRLVGIGRRLQVVDGAGREAQRQMGAEANRLGARQTGPADRPPLREDALQQAHGLKEVEGIRLGKQAGRHAAGRQALRERDRSLDLLVHGAFSETRFREEAGFSVPFLQDLLFPSSRRPFLEIGLALLGFADELGK